MKFLLCTLILICPYCIAAAEYKCGKLNINQVYDESHTTEFDEFPWIGRILHRVESTGEKIFFCIANLINERHLLAPAQCMFNRNSVPETVILGDWQIDNDVSEPDCYSDGFCAPPPKEYNIQDIVVHPNYQHRGFVHDIAIIRLEKDVKFSEYIRPICLPPPVMYGNDLHSQCLRYAGFATENREQQMTRLKSIAHVIPLDHCINKTQSKISSRNFCASYVGKYSFISGSPLMGKNILNGKLQDYYIIGMVCYATFSKSVIIDVVVNVSKYMSWIYSNINYKLESRSLHKSNTPITFDDLSRERIWN